MRPSVDWPELKNCDLTPRYESDGIPSSDLSSSCPDDNKLSLHDDEDVCSSMVEPGNITSSLHRPTLDNTIPYTCDICLPNPLCNSLSLCATAQKYFVNPLIWDITLQVTSMYDHMALGFSKHGKPDSNVSECCFDLSESRSALLVDVTPELTWQLDIQQANTLTSTQIGHGWKHLVLQKSRIYNVNQCGHNICTTLEQHV